MVQNLLTHNNYGIKVQPHIGGKLVMTTMVCGPVLFWWPRKSKRQTFQGGAEAFAGWLRVRPS